ncbi:FAD-binding oxidoreductase [Pontibacter sp. G13]|uniref:FAD-binding oxidoreductase n=1 Tax=Pontibacter sp. G13 TaxID=3074898 RepID=UPI00288BC00C|nr:FAD-binding oxidoreductase [Pontibacter sp. G13]WNJ16228.1 FAD-binding oxidoreductase [Pontibacter sp. G13]
MSQIRPISGWGGYPKALLPQQSFSGSVLEGVWIGRGAGRAYGDAALGPQILNSRRHNRFLEFDRTLGIVTIEAGVTMRELILVVSAAGWIPPVIPGTQFITLGGAVAADVHGKNHHRIGSIGNHILSMDLILADGTRVTCSPSVDASLFQATIGGMGLTGWIESITLQLAPFTSSQFHVRNQRFDQGSSLIEASGWATEASFQVAWIDTLGKGQDLGRGMWMVAEPVPAVTSESRDSRILLPEPKMSAPAFLPSGLVNNWTIRAFNQLYFFKKSSGNPSQNQPFHQFFFPLDAIRNWNKLYGPKGFLQYQFVLPRNRAKEGMNEILARMSHAKIPTFLGVLKAMGQGRGYLSFPMEGLTLSVDIPFSEKRLKILEEWDECVIRYGGRVYLAKDARMKPEAFEAMYPELDAFKKILRTVNPQGKIRSKLSERLNLHS